MVVKARFLSLDVLVEVIQGIHILLPPPGFAATHLDLQAVHDPAESIHGDEGNAIVCTIPCHTHALLCHGRVIPANRILSNRLDSQSE